MKRILILYAHPSQHRSEVNQPLFEASSDLDHVSCVDLYGEYPTFHIDIEREQKRLLAHDIIVFQFPVFWYSTPAILKEWQDLVLEYGFAYGTNGNALSGKHFFCAISAGGKEDAYQTEGYAHFTIREILTPLEQTSNITGMRYLPPFVLFGSRTASEEGRIQTHVESWRSLLVALGSGTVDLDRASALPTLNHILEPQA